MSLGASSFSRTAHKPVPRGIARSGPAILSYGFRPFFLGAGSFALVAMIGWVGALAFGWEIGGYYGALNWHAHEMLFGYASAALAGYALTAVPNWTGRLPVSGPPLLALVATWGLGRLAMAFPAVLGLPVAMLIDGLFLPLLATIVAIEIVAGRNWKNLRVVVGLGALAAANVAFHFSVLSDGSASDAGRFAVSIYVALIAVVGGRIVPSFTHNWLVKRRSPVLPAPADRFDAVAILVLIAALVLWATMPEGPLTAATALGAAGLNALRLARWRGWRTTDEPLLLALHVGYAFVPLGLAAVALAAMGWMQHASALHVLTVGAIGNMTFAVMTRASLGHTGRALTASAPTSAAYLALALAAVVRPFAEMIPSHYHLLLSASGALWMIAFAIFVAEYGPMLVTRRRN